MINIINNKKINNKFVLIYVKNFNDTYFTNFFFFD